MILKSIIEIFYNLEKKDKIKIYFLMVVMITTAFFEIAYIYLIFQFIGYISMGEEFFSTIGIIQRLNLNYYLEEINLKSLSTIVVFVVLLAQLMTVLNIYLTTKFSFLIGLNISSSLYKYYLKRNYLDHVSSSLSDMINKIDDQVTRIIAQVLVPVLHIISKIILILPILFFAFLYDLNASLIIFSFLSLFYFAFFISFKKIILNKSGYVSILTKRRYKLMHETFNLISEIKIHKLSSKFLNQFKKIGIDLTNTYTFLTTIRSLPRSILEIIAVIILLLLVVYNYDSLENNFNTLAVSISAFFLILYKLLPSFQTIYINFSHLKSGVPAYQILREDIFASGLVEYNQHETNEKKVEFKSLELMNLSFSYDNKKDILKNINFKINKKEKIGIVGLSGSGKTTLINILLSLIDYKNGKIFLNDIELKNKNDLLKSKISFVPQNPVIIDGTVKENITVTESESNIKVDDLENAVKNSNLKEVVNQMSAGINTIIGENGISLSGGQKQRLALARALYKKPDLLILDEATSSLDKLVESEIVNHLINKEKNLTLIIISHNINLLKNCDKIIFIENSLLVGNGKFDDLYKENLKFKSLIDVQNNK